MRNLKNRTNKKMYQSRNRLIDAENKVVAVREAREGKWVMGSENFKRGVIK